MRDERANNCIIREVREMSKGEKQSHEWRSDEKINERGRQVSEMGGKQCSRKIAFIETSLRDYKR